jgi:addiction module HigA family antidote
MTKRHKSIPPVHPGEILSNTVFPALNTTKPALAKALGVSRQTLHDIMSCDRSVTPEMAVRLEKVVGSTADTWLKLQAEYDLTAARETLKSAGLRRLRPAA